MSDFVCVLESRIPLTRSGGELARYRTGSSSSSWSLLLHTCAGRFTVVRLISGKTSPSVPVGAGWTRFYTTCHAMLFMQYECCVTPKQIAGNTIGGLISFFYPHRALDCWITYKSQWCLVHFDRLTQVDVKAAAPAQGLQRPLVLLLEGRVWMFQATVACMLVPVCFWLFFFTWNLRKWRSRSTWVGSLKFLTLYSLLKQLVKHQNTNGYFLISYYYYLLLTWFDDLNILTSCLSPLGVQL